MFVFVWHRKENVKEYTYHDAEWFFILALSCIFEFFYSERFVIKLHNYS